MFALFNPPKGAKYAKKGRKATKRKGRRKVGAYASFVKRYFASHPGTTLAAAASAWSGGEGKIRKHRAARAKVHGRTPRKYVLRSAVPGIVGSAMKSNICNVSSLQRARAKYCDTSAKTGIGGFIERFKSAPTAIGDRLRSAAELGYRAVANNSGRKSMKRGRKRGGFSPLKFNLGQYVNPPQVSGSYGGVLSGVRPKNITGVVPVIGGYAINAMISGYIAGKIPMIKSGAGNYALGLVSAGLIGAAAGAILGRNVGEGVFTGAVVEPIVRAVRDVSSKGFGALGLSGWEGSESWEFQDLPGALTDNVRGQPVGMGDFSTPGQITAAMPTESSTSQYSLPAATAQVTPQQRMQAYEDAVVAEAMNSQGGM